MDIRIIAAIDHKNSLGGDNKLLWRVSGDLRRFRELTTNNVVIMGRKTYDSIGKPLKNRENIVISRSLSKSIYDNLEYVNSLESAIDLIKHNEKYKNKIIYIIGGGQIYKESFNKLDISTLEITRILGDYSHISDTFFPVIDESWYLSKKEINIAVNGDTNLCLYETYKK